MRIAAALCVAGLATLLATCGGDAVAGGGSAPDSTGQTPNPSSSGGTSADAQTISCALRGAGTFASSCTIEKAEIDGKTLLTVFHPDGGFRRFEQLADGSGLAAVAGADAVTQTLSGDTLEIALAGNRYRFPASSR